MKVLIVCRSKKGGVSPYISRQVESIRRRRIQTEYFLICHKGWSGYLKYFPELVKQIDLFKPNIIHAHYGYSGLLAVMQRKVPVIITFHGSDINNPKNRIISKVANYWSSFSIFVTQKLAFLAKAKKNLFSIIPCGVDLIVFHPVNKSESRRYLGYPPEEILVLFSGSFRVPVKNYPLAISALSILNQHNSSTTPIRLIELSGYSTEEVNLLLNACDVALLTSISEGSPNFIKEAMACNRPIVSTDVGDVRDLVEGIPGCFISESNPKDVADKIKQALEFENSIGARERIIDREMGINETARKIVAVYEQVHIKKHKSDITNL